MRILFAAAFAALLTLVTGCQDTEARLQNAKLQADLENLKKSPANDDLTKLLLANQSKGGGDSMDEVNRKLASISGDLAAGIKNLEKAQDDAAKAQSKRTDDLETKLKKVDDLQTALTNLKSMIETLESKVKNVDPNQVLDIQRKLLDAEAALRAEQETRKRVESDLKAAQVEAETNKNYLAELQKELSDLKSSPAAESNKKLRDKITTLEIEIENVKTDRDNIKKQHEDLLEQLRKGGTAVPDTTEKPKDPKDTPENPPKDGVYAFEGVVATVTGGGKPGEASNVLINPKSGETPPENTELIVLNEKNETVCRVKVTRLFYKGGDTSKPVDQVGGKTVSQKLDNPVVKGYRVVWVKTTPSEEKPKDGGASGQ